MSDESKRELFSSGSPHESVLGYSRAVLNRIAAALDQAGAALADVVRTRVYLTDISDFDAVARVHGKFFADIRPATTVVAVTALADPALLVEIEADAITARA